MTEFYVHLHTVNDVKQFVSAASALRADVDVMSGRYTVDGKSLLGLCSLELERPVQVRVYGPEEDGTAFRDSVAEMVVEPPEET